MSLSRLRLTFFIPDGVAILPDTEFSKMRALHIQGEVEGFICRRRQTTRHYCIRTAEHSLDGTKHVTMPIDHSHIEPIISFGFRYRRANTSL